MANSDKNILFIYDYIINNIDKLSNNAQNVVIDELSKFNSVIEKYNKSSKKEIDKLFDKIKDNLMKDVIDCGMYEFSYYVHIFKKHNKDVETIEDLFYSLSDDTIKTVLEKDNIKFTINYE
jgi:translation elongation factor EF-G